MVRAKGIIYKGNCLNCNEYFETDQPRKKFCCRRCKDSYNGRNKYKVSYDKVCNICGKPFTTSYVSQLSCSDECKLTHERDRHARWAIENEEKMREYNRRSRYKIPGDKICPICGIQYEGRKLTYCSKKCAAIAKEHKKAIRTGANVLVGFWKEKLRFTYQVDEEAKITDMVILDTGTGIFMWHINTGEVHFRKYDEEFKLVGKLSVL